MRNARLNHCSKVMLGCLAALLLVNGCGQKPVDPKFYNNAAVVKDIRKAKGPDYWPTLSWRTSSPEEHGMDSGKLADFVKDLNENDINSFLIIRDGYIVAEGYNRDTKPDMLQDTFSVTKSVTAALTGIAIHEKKLKGTDEKISKYFPYIAGEESKKDITIGNLLNMRAGLYWNNEGERATNEMIQSPNWEQYILGQPMASAPGTAFNYSNGNAHLMSILLEKALGGKLEDFAREALFKPLGITNFTWGEDKQGHTNGAYSIKLTLRDMAKLGLLYMHNGKWNGQEVVPSDWVEESITKVKDTKYTDGTLGGYGYFWWMKKLTPATEGKLNKDVFFALGSEGQRVFVIPEDNLMVAMTGSNVVNPYAPEALLVRVVEAEVGKTAIQANDAAKALLDEAIREYKKTTNVSEKSNSSKLPSQSSQPSQPTQPSR
jgi:CubicO group peptidase (beta-lactamase class C family)